MKNKSPSRKGFIAGRGRLLGAAFVLAAAVGLTASVDARAETLYRALSSAYESNPTLRAERARQRATDEGVSQALSGWRPTIIADGDAGVVDVETTPGPNTSFEPYGFAVTLNQPLFRGFRTINSTEQAERIVLAGQQTLLIVEQNVLFDGVTAYMNVLRDARIASLRKENVGNLEEQLRGTQARFNVGELTQTDVAQSRARLSRARSDLATARANLAVSRANFVRVIGRTPASLKYPKSIRRKLPKTLDGAIAMANGNNPTILAAQYSEEASKYAVDVAVGDLLPSADLEARYSHEEDPDSITDNRDTLSLIGRVSVPLYQAGREASEVREAKQVNHQRKQEVLEAVRDVHDQVVTAWNRWIEARESIKSDTDEVAANTLAYKGIQQEALVGSRTILDVLDTNEDLINSRILLVASRRDEVVAAYALLATIGALTAERLPLPVALYDPTVNLDEVRYKFFGLGINSEE
ncbi:MAG: TolC family outer membrane protein [Hyphomicrobiales bacterium]